MRTMARFESCYVALIAGLWAEREAIVQAQNRLFDELQRVAQRTPSPLPQRVA